VTMTITVETYDAAVAALRDGKLDLTVNIAPASPDRNFVQEHLLEDTMVVFAAAGHRLAKRNQITMADLAEERWTATAFSAPAFPHVSMALQRTVGSPPRVVARTTSLSLRNRLVASTDLLGTSSRRVLKQAASRHRLVELPVKDFEGKRSVAVFYRKDAYLSPAARRFMEILKHTARNISE
jgi:DNA-binding transcriptional LysR family regulator